MQAMGLVALWERGYVEPVIPPPSPLHILAQQLMALALQERGIGRRTWYDWVSRMPGFSSIPAATREQIVEWMLTQEILWEEEGILWFGKRGKKSLAARTSWSWSRFSYPPRCFLCSTVGRSWVSSLR